MRNRKRESALWNEGNTQSHSNAAQQRITAPQHLWTREVSDSTRPCLYICLHEIMDKAKYRQISDEFYLVTWDNGEWKILHSDKILEDYLPIN